MSVEGVEKIRGSLLKLAPDIFSKHPVLFAYLYGSYATGLVHPFSDLDIGIYVERISIRQCLELELSLALEIDEKLGSGVACEVRIINNLPLVLTGKIITEGMLIFSRNETIRVDFETSVRSAYFDFLPVVRRYQSIYIQSIVS
ncbi:MAG: nucleotidyltransferase domain-containing protein [Deltaproteobacteria bacterium]|nr:nucleotidyltransferase domain-containing protein [Deltaproteobacteria bacterium]MBW1796588.1 nucleotidyltransferase domain-containing protein [Deltaproteobacteria bacterium]